MKIYQCCTITKSKMYSCFKYRHPYLGCLSKSGRCPWFQQILHLAWRLGYTTSFYHGLTIIKLVYIFSSSFDPYHYASSLDRPRKFLFYNKFTFEFNMLVFLFWYAIWTIVLFDFLGILYLHLLIVFPHLKNYTLQFRPYSWQIIKDYLSLT